MEIIDLPFEVTDWFPSWVKPRYIGHYMTRFDGKEGFAYWNGGMWSGQYQNLDRLIHQCNYAFAVQHKEWRGLARPIE